MVEDLGRVFERCWHKLCALYKIRMEHDPFFTESDIHHAFANLLEKENVGNVHVEYPLPLDPDKHLEQLKRFGQVSFGRGYYRADICILKEIEPRLIAEIRWEPALFLPIAFLKKRKLLPMQEIKRVEEKLIEERRLNDLAISDRHMNKLLRNIEKFLDILRRYENIQGYFCVLDELCPSVDKQLNDKIKEFDVPTNFRILACYIE